jgi:hypothetical protein
MTDDPWRLAEWSALPERCLIASCSGDEIDVRGPVFLIDGSMHKACVEHWEAIMRILGEQQTWERRDGVRGNYEPLAAEGTTP